MSNQEILEKATKKAIDGGWTGRGTNVDNIVQEAMHQIYEPEFSVTDIIFNHDFAKALWPGKGLGIMEYRRGREVEAEHWRYHLQRMVVADDPIKYLGENIL